jgi:hypothetical protein
MLSICSLVTKPKRVSLGLNLANVLPILGFKVGERSELSNFLRDLQEIDEE